MAEPEGLLVEGARLATIAARDLWWRLAPPRERTVFPLVRIRQRLELFLGALYVGAPSILPADPPPAPTWLARLAGRAPRHLTRQTATAATDGARIWLPRAVESSEGEARAVDTYRLLAVEMAARADRGTPRHAPPGGSDPLVRDLYLLAEAVAIDRAIAESFPGLAPDLHAARRAALDERPPLDRLTPVERAVERIVRDALRAEWSTPVRDVLRHDDAVRVQHLGPRDGPAPEDAGRAVPGDRDGAALGARRARSSREAHGARRRRRCIATGAPQERTVTPPAPGP